MVKAKGNKPSLFSKNKFSFAFQHPNYCFSISTPRKLPKAEKSFIAAKNDSPRLFFLPDLTFWRT